MNEIQKYIDTNWVKGNAFLLPGKIEEVALKKDGSLEVRMRTIQLDRKDINDMLMLHNINVELFIKPIIYSPFSDAEQELIK